MRKKIETRKKLGRICALVVVGMFVVMTLPTSVVAPPGPTPWTGTLGGDPTLGWEQLGTATPDDLRIVTGGVQRMVVDGITGTGNVGIGLPLGVPPMNKLDVSGNMAVGLAYAGRLPAPPNGMIVEGWVGIGTPSPGTTLHVKTYQADRHIRVEREDQYPYPEGTYMDLISGGAFCAIDCVSTYDEVFQIQEDGIARLHIKKGGNVGIGTVTPSTRLEVNGVITATGGNSNEWNTAYSWGDHALAGYITEAYADNRYVNEGQSNSITTGMIVDRAVDGTKIAIGSHVSGSVQFGPVFKVTNAETSNSDPVGIMGEVTGSHETVGVHGKAGDSGVWPAYGAGVWGESDNGPGVIGTSVSWHGVVGSSDSGYAGFFEGDAKVTNDLTVVGQIYKGKCNFKIDHPLDPANKYLIHTCVESSDMINLYNGVVELDEKGEAWVEFPEWFGTLNKDFRYQLTPIGAPGPGLYIAEEISGNRFKIAGGVPDMKVSWQVTGIRNDPFAEEYPTIVEELKPEHERGKYLHPELYGMPENMAIGYIEHNLKDR